MSTLIIRLPWPIAAEFDYLLSDDAQTVTNQGRVSAALLPTLSRQAGHVIAVAPVQALSWHRIELPKGVLDHGVLARRANRPRLRAVLEGLLEEQLLDEPSQMHFAIAPQQQAAQPGWVAACDRNWLATVLGMLENAQIPPDRVVPEFVPETGIATPTLYVIQSTSAPQLVVPGPQGVSVLPLGTVALSLLAGKESQSVFAEPAVAAATEQVFGRSVSLLSIAQRTLQATQSDWNLAQFEFAGSGQERWQKKLMAGWRRFKSAPEWQAARWSALVLLLSQLLGVATWVWAEQAALTDKREAIRNTLQQTFPDVRIVLDAPLQMEREVQALRQGAGAASPQDLEALLGALGTATPAHQSLSAIEYRDGTAKLEGLKLSPDEALRMTQKMQAQAYSVQAQGQQWVVRAERQP